MRASKRVQWLAKRPSRKQSCHAAPLIRADQHDVRHTRRTAMLKRIVQHRHVRAAVARQLNARRAIRRENDGNPRIQKCVDAPFVVPHPAHDDRR